jgi:Asp-tRNA(Asn)/Glu-tRNA(Gln) amidotransferase A subunit family amidase
MLIHPAPLSEIAAALQSGQLPLIDYVEQVCGRLEVVEDQLQALLPEPNRRARLLKEAAALEAHSPHPPNRPPLYGISVGVKDIFHVDGFITRGGSQLPPEEFAGPEAACVTKLKAAGALILGKTVTTEFAYFEPGPTRNPHNLAHTPGGSSSGSAAAVAAGYCPLALGTQTIGSVIRPAAYCGLVGFKPSYGRIDPGGLIFVSRSLDHVGLFTQDVNGMILAASIVCKNWQALAEQNQSDHLPVLGVPEGSYLTQASPEGLTAFERQLGRLEEAGYRVRRVSALNDIETVTQRHLDLMAGEMAKEHITCFKKYRPLYRPRTAALIQQGQAVTAEKMRAARAARTALRVNLQTLMTETGIDLWVAPAAPGSAPKGIQATGNPAMNLPWTQAGLPVITVPAGYASNGLPLGLQIISPFMTDEKLLAWAGPMAQMLGEHESIR